MKNEEDSPLALEGYLKGKSFTEVLLEVKSIPPVRSPTSWEECVSGPPHSTIKER